MSKSETIRARTEPNLKRKVENIFRHLGISASEAINIFYQHVKLYNGFPFDIRIPKAGTLQALRDVDKKKNLIKAKDTKELFRQLED